MACPHCGSWSVKADRSLAGRLVCGRCGRPLGSVAPGRTGRRSVRRPRLPRLLRLTLVLLAFSAVLAWFADSPGRFSDPPPTTDRPLRHL